MTIHNPSLGNAPGLPVAKIVPAKTLAEIRDLLTLALDQIETGQMDLQGLTDAVAYQRDALNLSNRQLEGMTK